MHVVVDEWEKATEGFFESYESAMKNSALLETDVLSEKFMGLAQGATAFHDLDVVDDRE